MGRCRVGWKTDGLGMAWGWFVFFGVVSVDQGLVRVGSALFWGWCCGDLGKDWEWVEGFGCVSGMVLVAWG